MVIQTSIDYLSTEKKETRRMDPFEQSEQLLNFQRKCFNDSVELSNGETSTNALRTM